MDNPLNLVKPYSLKPTAMTCDNPPDFIPEITIKTTDNPLDTQIGGDHYKGFEIQPVEFTIMNKLSFPAGCIVKYISRYDKDGGKGLQDLKKIKHYVDLIIQLDGWTEEGKNIY